MDDILTVVTSRAEKSFSQNLTAAKEEVSKLEKERKEKTSTRDMQRRSEVEYGVSGVVNGIKPGIEQLGGTVNVSETDDKDDVVTAVVKIGTKGGGYNSSVDFKVEVKKSLVLKSMQNDVKELNEKIVEAQRVAMEWKKKLANIPQLERQYKGKIAEAKLAESADGQMVLDLLTGDLEQQMLLLPTN